MDVLRRRLPHWYLENKALFITWHLHGSLPKCRYPPPEHPSSGQAFVWMDRYLNTTREGPMWLRQPEVASAVRSQICSGAGRFYNLYAWVIMSNHVHLLVRPLIEPNEMIRRIKGRTAHEANLLIGNTGQPFWQAESYDRWMRSDEETRKVTRYIENNPVVAGLVASPEQYKWSSAGAEAPVAG